MCVCVCVCVLGIAAPLVGWQGDPPEDATFMPQEGRWTRESGEALALQQSGGNMPLRVWDLVLSHKVVLSACCVPSTTVGAGEENKTQKTK